MAICSPRSAFRAKLMLGMHSESCKHPSFTHYILIVFSPVHPVFTLPFCPLFIFHTAAFRFVLASTTSPSMRVPSSGSPPPVSSVTPSTAPTTSTMTSCWSSWASPPPSTTMCRLWLCPLPAHPLAPCAWSLDGETPWAPVSIALGWLIFGATIFQKS